MIIQIYSSSSTHPSIPINFELVLQNPSIHPSIHLNSWTYNSSELVLLTNHSKSIHPSWFMNIWLFWAGGLEPLSLWGLTLKCPCGPVCAIWTIKISTAAPLYAEYAVCVGHKLPRGHHRSCSKTKQQKKNMWRAIPVSAARDRSHSHVYGWMQMIITDGQLCPWNCHQQSGAEKRKKRDEN